MNRLYILLAVLLANISLLTLSSCSDDDNSGGAPEIHCVRTTNPELADSTFTEATVGQMILIEGVNLDGAVHVYINNQDVYFNSNYNTSRHLIIIILLTVPKGETTPQAEKGEKSGISGSMVYFGALCLITGIFVATFNTNIAMYIDRKGIGDASTAGTVASIMQVIGIVGGLILGFVVKTFKRFTIGASILVMAAGTALVGLTTSFPTICVGAVLVGIGFAIRNPGAVTFGANMVPAAQASLAIAIISATYNVGNFISSYVVNPLANMLGEDIANRFIVSAAALAVIGIVACIKAPTTDAQALDSQN